MKIYLLADSASDWCPKNQLAGFRKFSTFEFADSPEAADMIWILSYYLPLDSLGEKNRLGFLWSTRGRKRSLRDILIICTFAHLYHPKEPVYLPRLRLADQISDAIHFFSERNIFENLDYFSSPIIHLPYWVDLDEFYPLPPDKKEMLRRSLEIPPGRAVIGSFQRDTESDMETPKLEKGPDILCDILEGLDTSAIHVLLTGPQRNYVEGRLERAGIPFSSLGMVARERMNEIYNCLDYYLVTSRTEGGPQAILESMATRTPIYSTPVGVSDMLQPSVVLQDSAAFVKALSEPYPDVVDIHFADIQKHSGKTIIPMYERAFQELFEARRKSRKNLYRYTQNVRWYNIGENRPQTD